MPAAFHTVGPVEIYIKQRTNGTLNSGFYYLGTAQSSPEVDRKYAYHAVMNDLGGRLVSSTDCYDGEMHQVSFTLNRFNWQTVNRLNDGLPGPTITAGGDTATARGRIFRGVDDYQLLLVNTYFSVTAANNGDMPAGRLYYNMKPLAVRESRVGQRVEEITYLLECIADFDKTARNWILFTQDPTAWGTVTPE